MAQDAISKRYRVKSGAKVDLDDFDAGETKLIDDKDVAVEKSAAIQESLGELQELLYATHQHKLLIILQGMDTSGKDGTVRHVMGGFNPAGVRVVPFKRPTEEELEHDYLWRVHRQVPGAGEVVVFNRSHYEDVLVVRVHELVPEDVWRARYDQINAFERLLVDTGTIVLKFFLHISRKEQRKRLQARIDDPTKRWKYQHGDLDERKLWDDYEKAYEEAIARTSTDYAPWYIVPADTKWYRNFIVGSVLQRALEKLDMKYPEIDLSSEVVE
jgi:PPK2 family polyphosphate:nucleotide phosphotransferase